MSNEITYTYDHTGTRTVKSHGPMEAVYVNGAPQRDPIYLYWLNPDPLTEKYPMYSAYSYCYGNPVRFIDPTGMEGEWWRTVWNTIKDPDGLEGRADPANEGNITVQDVRATANGMEAISDAADAVAVGAAATGVGIEIAAGAKTVGTVAGAVGDFINAAIDIYEGKDENFVKRIGGIISGVILPKSVKATTEESKIVRNVIADKAVDYGVNKTLKK